jgi:hypothetical protein
MPYQYPASCPMRQYRAWYLALMRNAQALLPVLR